MNKWKLGVIISLSIALFLLGRCNGINSVIKNSKSDTIINKYDSIISYVPIPVKVIKDTLIYKIRTIHDTLESAKDVVYLPAETPEWIANIVKDYNDMREYDTTIFRLSDTVSIKDLVYQNKIINRRIRTVFSDTFITKNTILKTSRRMVGYLTTDIIANKRYVGAAIGLALKNKNDRVYKASIMKINSIPVIYSFGICFPIRLFPKHKNY